MRIAALFCLAAAATLAACVPPYVGRGHSQPALKPVSRLDCPDSEGELKRVSATPDGRSCAYSYIQQLSELHVVEGLR